MALARDARVDVIVSGERRPPRTRRTQARAGARVRRHRKCSRALRDQKSQQRRPWRDAGASVYAATRDNAPSRPLIRLIRSG